MKYYSLSNPTIKKSFENAVVNGIAPDRGLYFPEEIPPLDTSFFEELPQLSIPEMAYTAMAPFVGDEIPQAVLENILKNTLDFDFPVVSIKDNMGSLELFHGPTLAFKDVGARFMAQCLGYFNSKNAGQVTVLVATSGDTGGAVANGFLGVEGIDVVILYPKGKVSKVQEQQLTTLGQNITALEVEGVFDDCQDMVKTAFLDQEITAKRKLTSANSINVARWLPQMLYYFIAYRQLAHRKEPLVFSVPSGNFGNICAGMIGQNMGLPIDHFIAATNINDAVPAYLETGQYAAVKTTPTISNAMDVGDPSNFVRIQKIYGNNFTQLKDHLSGYRFTDDATREAMREIYHTSSYIADPHGAVGYLGLKDYLEKHPGKYGVFLETAHPVKFLDTVEETLERKVPMPERIQSLLDKEKKSIGIKNYADLKSYLLS
ncbi:MAG: threonine synthase [Flavobacteriaceae bacterium]|nr:threonine synthase [Flavobacteriaceae bacterium]